MYFQETRKLLRTLVDVPIQVVRATVNEVDTDNWTAEVITVNEGGTRYDVQLRVIGDGKSLGLITVPKKDSMVLIGIIDNNPESCYIVQCSEIVKVHIEMGNDLLIEIPEDGKVKIKAKEVLFDGANNGLVDLDKLVQRINKIEQNFNTHNHLVNLTTAKTESFLDSVNTPIIPTTSKNNIETDKISWP